MEDEKKPDLASGIDAAAATKLEKIHFQRELRGLEMKAYSGVLEALRASGKPNAEKDGIIKTLRDFFNVSDDRHKAELRVLAYDEKLSIISQKLTGYDFTDEWAFHAQRIYVPLGQQPFSLFRSYPTSYTRSCTTIRDPVPIRKNNATTTKYDEDSDVHSDAELELIDSIIKDHPVCNGWPPEKQRPISIAVDLGTGNEEEIEEVEHQLRRRKFKKQQSFIPAKSPDITDTPRTAAGKLANLRSDSKPSYTTKARGVKRKESEEFINSPVENISVASSKKLSQDPKSRHKLKKTHRMQPKMKIVSTRSVALPVETKRVKESSEETSSADEGENGPLPLEESSRVMSPVFSEVIRSSVLSRGRGPRGRGGVDRRKNSSLTSPSKVKAGKARPRTPNQKSGKFKNSIPTSGSRRKSKLNEKIDYDDVLMDLDGNEMEKQAVYTSNSDEVPRRLLLDSQSFDRIGDSRASFKDFKSSEDCAIYAESLPINYNHEDMEQVTDGVFKRPLPPSKGPKPWEIKDARLSQREESVSDENNSSTFHFGEVEVGHQHHHIISSDMPVIPGNGNTSDGMSLSPNKHELPPPSKKQRIKSPLIVNPNINPPNVSKVPLPAPVFSTTLSSVSKKRQSKPISVVDSLNLHLPTTATASSLAASSNNRRPGAATGGGCSMFSNSSALIAGARGTAPGILQQQRKAQPHILANSKAHQRAFVPSMTVGSSLSNSVNNNVIPPISGTCAFTAGTVPANSPVVAASATSPIPISAISSVPPSSPIPFQSFPSSNSSSINLGNTAMPIGHVNRTGTGANIIFLQKSNGPVVGSGASTPTNVIPIKQQPRAVILRRTQLPRQGNVMILDMQKNQIVTQGQASPFLQTARILNAPGDLSVLNIQSSTSPIKSPTSIAGPPHSTSSETSPVQTLLSPPQMQKSDGIVIQAANQESFIATLSEAHQTNHQYNDTADTMPTMHSNQEAAENDNAESIDQTEQQEAPQQDVEYAQIEAALMQMEGETYEQVVYEEEVTTEIVPLEDGTNTQYIYTNDTCPTIEGENIMTSQEVSSHNASYVSGSSTDTASENETSLHHFESPDNDNSSTQAFIKKVSLGPVEEVKIASDAISRALSLNNSSSPVKKLTFSSAPITLGTSTFSEPDGKPVCEGTTFSTSSASIDFMPAFDVNKPTSSELTSSTVVVEGDSSSTNNIHVVNSNSSETFEITIHNNDVLQQYQQQVQENANAS